MTLQRVKPIRSVRLVMGGSFPDELRTKDLDFTKTASFNISGSTL